MTVAELVIDILIRNGVRHVFTVPAFQINPLIEAALSRPEIEVIVANHEHMAGAMADGNARARGSFAVCLTMGNIGLSYAHPAVLTASSDFSRVLFLTGNSPLSLRRREAFQSGFESGSDDIGLFCSITRYCATMVDANQAEGMVSDAICAMGRSPNGPALVSIPYDIQRQRAGKVRETVKMVEPEPRSNLEHLTELFVSKTGIVLLAGTRVNEPGGEVAIRRLAEAYALPVATTYSAKGLLPEDHPMSLGNFGFAGSRRAKEALLDDEVEILLLLGTSWTERDSMNWDERISPPGRLIIRVDSRPEDPQADAPVHHHLLANPVEFLDQLLANTGVGEILESTRRERQQMLERWRRIPRHFDPADGFSTTNQSGVALRGLVKKLRQSLPDDVLLLVDAGDPRIFAGAYWESRRPFSFLSSSALSGMGWTCGAAIGAQLARPGSPVVMLIGDGSLLMHGLELATMVRYRLPIAVVLCNNGHLASFQRRLEGTGLDKSVARTANVDWVRFGQSVGARTARVADLESVEKRLIEHWTAADEEDAAVPLLLEVLVEEQPCMPDVESTESGYHRSSDLAIASSSNLPK